MYEFWKIKNRPFSNFDCLILLPYAVKSRSEINNPTKKIVEMAYKLWLNNPKIKIIMSTGDNQNLGLSNAEVMANYALNLGVPRKALYKEEKSVNTKENLQYSLEIVDRLELSRPMILCLDLHARRAVAIAKKLGWKDLKWQSVYAKGEAGYGNKSIQTSSRPIIFLYEVAAYIHHKIFEWI